ncbi:MAG: membrane dipeptidase [Candidatus Caccovivens sp.]
MQYPICDSHNDFLTELPMKELTPYIKECKAHNVKTICASYWSTRKNKDEIVDDLQSRTNILRKTAPSFLSHIEDLWWIQDEITLKKLVELQPFSCSLTWNDSNLLASGTLSNGGLTDWGKKCLLELSNNGIKIDTAHLNRQSFKDVVKLLPQNIYCSHTGFCGIKKHKRNLTDSQIEQIVRSNGFIGLFFYNRCIQTTKDFTIDDIVQNLNYFTTRWGFDNIGLGTDFYGIETYPKNLHDYNDLQILAKTLKKEGYSERQIEKIFYKNFETFAQRS